MRFNLKIISILVLIFNTFICTEILTKDLPELRWAADAESGAPYVFQNPENPNELIGFEVEIIDAIARELKMKPVHVQQQWDNLIPGLDRKDYDVVINGIEITEDRLVVVNFSRPYFVTYLQLVVRAENNDVKSMTECRGKAVGTLSGSFAERYMNEMVGGINVKGYESEANSYLDLKNGRLDAVLIDYPVAKEYALPEKTLKFVGSPIGMIEYGLALRKGDTVLLKKINNVLGTMLKSGELEKIYTKWDLLDDFLTKWIDTTVKKEIAGKGDKRPSSGSKEPRDFNFYFNMLPFLGEGAMWTIILSILSMLLAIIIGLMVALIRVYSPPPFSQLAVGYVELIRGTPLLIQLYFIFFVLPNNLGIMLTPFVAGTISLGLNYAAYEAENYRAGLFSVPKGQMEAAIALGMTRRQALRYIIVPQAVRLVLPPITNDFISLLKDSSLVSVITMIELTKASQLIVSRTFDYLGVYLLTAAIYLLIGLPFVRLSKWAEVKFSPEKQRR
jgi:polar amino acid transport system substrate-binding protein